MQKAAAFFLLLFFGISVLLFAQDDSEPDTEPDWGDNYANDLYTKGDQTLCIALGTGFPIVFINNGKKIDHKIDPPIIGTGYLNYLYYFNAHFFTGGEVGLLFLRTLGGNTVFNICFGARVGTQFTHGRFEFPFSIALGGTVQTYLDYGYFGYYMKGGASAYFRATPEWSFGLASNLCWFPQWIRKDPSKNVDALFVDLSVIGRYHF